jgi:hypothetical protein
MTLTIELSEEQVKRLAARANGRSLEDYAREILAGAAGRPIAENENELDGRRTLIRLVASLPVEARRPIMRSLAQGVSPETGYDNDWVDLDEIYED